MSVSIVDRVVAACGTQQDLAHKLGISRSAIALWKRSGRIPVERCLTIERVTGISRFELRPDIYGEAP